MSTVHRNSDENDELHHIYVIIDKTDNSIFKYGISCGPIKDGLSKRMRIQLRYLNVIDDWTRFLLELLFLILKDALKQNGLKVRILRHTN